MRIIYLVCDDDITENIVRASDLRTRTYSLFNWAKIKSLVRKEIGKSIIVRK